MKKLPYKKKSPEELKKEIDQLSSKMEKSVENYFRSPKDMKEYLDFMGKFHNYSTRNSALIDSQFKGAQAVGSFQFWKKNGFSVNKGEKGSKIFVPTEVKLFKNDEGKWESISKASEEQKALIEKNKVETRKVKNFKIGHVFDVSQTNAKASDLPKIFPNRWIEGEVKDHDLFQEGLKSIADEMNVAIKPASKELGAAKGVYYLLRNEIELNPRNSKLQNTATLIHELAHAKMHNFEKLDLSMTAAEKEFQAEMVSYVVSSHFGIGDDQKHDYTLRYLDSWTKGKELKDKAKLLEEVREVSHGFIDTIGKTFTKEKNAEYQKANKQKNKELVHER